MTCDAYGALVCPTCVNILSRLTVEEPVQTITENRKSALDEMREKAKENRKLLQEKWRKDLDMRKQNWLRESKIRQNMHGFNLETTANTALNEPHNLDPYPTFNDILQEDLQLTSSD